MKLKLMTEETGIIVRKILYNPAVVYIEYPNGDIWEYVIYDNHTLKDIRYRYRHNIGQFVSAVKQAAGSDARVINREESIA